MKRPVPIILTAILLGLLALLQLLAALGTAAAGIFTIHKGVPQPPTSMPSPLPPFYLPFLMIGISIFYVALAAWSVVTLIGLIRLRSWARYSILVMAGLVSGFSVLGAIVTFATPLITRGMLPAQTTPQSNSLGAIFLVVGIVQLIFAAIAAALLVYYNLAETRALFAQYAPANLDPPNTSTGRPRPTAIAIISWFYLVTSPFNLIYAFLPLPALFFRFSFYGWAAHCFYATNAILCFVIGYGLFRLHEQARIAFFAWSAFVLLNMLPILTPWGSRNFQSYMQAFTPHTTVTGAPLIFPSSGMLLFIFGVGTAFILCLVWLLHRHRAAFTRFPLRLRCRSRHSTSPPRYNSRPAVSIRLWRHAAT